MQTGNLTIITNPAGASIYIDGTLVLDENGEPGLTPAILTIPVGYHSIKMTLEGYCIETDGQDIMQGENVNIFHNFYIC